MNREAIGQGWTREDDASLAITLWVLTPIAMLVAALVFL